MRPKTVVVTGASGGVGRAIAKAFGARGANVALLARGAAGLDAAARDVVAASGRALVVPTDVADHRAVDAAADRVEETFGPIDVWVNNAATSVLARFTDIEPDEFDRVTAVDYLGFANGTRAALRVMRPRDRGTIVQVGSALAYRGIPFQSAYCGAKHAIQGLHDSLRCELMQEGSGVHITMVQLPAMNTPQFDWIRDKLPEPAQPVPPIYQPEVAARAVLGAAEHPERREWWVGWSTVATLIGNAVAPGLLDRKLVRDGLESQQDDRVPATPDADNLEEPADEYTDFTAHGSFDDRAKPHSVQQWLSRHRGAMLAGASAAVGISAAWAMSATRRGAPG